MAGSARSARFWTFPAQPWSGKAPRTFRGLAQGQVHPGHCHLRGRLARQFDPVFFDPLALLLRTLTVSLWPALDRIVTALEAALVNVPFLADPLATFDGWIRPAVLPIQPVFYQTGLLSAAVFLAVILLNLLAARFWCRYLCPLGGGLGWLSKLAIFRRRVGSGCKGCTLCTDICPTGTIDPAKGYASDPAECTMCLDCLEVCRAA